MLKKSKIIKKLISAGIVFTLLGGISVQAATSIAGEVRLRLMQFYKNGVPLSVFQTESVDEIIKIINDKYTVYMSPEESRSFQNGINRKFYGIGAYIKEHEEGILITDVIKGGPSDGSGLEAGDIIVKVDDTSIRGMELSESRPHVTGDKDSKVVLTVEREGKVHKFTITRGEVVTPTIEYEWLNGGNTAHIIIRTFGERAYEEFYEIIKECKKAGAKNFIIDLRQNPGGYMDQAMKIGGLFVGDKTVIYTDSKSEIDVPAPGIKSDIMITEPVTILINENSASASEILSAAIKEYDGALFVGKNTFGKGVAQGMIELSDGGVLKVTVKEFYSPKFRKINGVGIKPHLEVDEINPLVLTEVLMDTRDEENMFYEDTENKEIKVVKEWAFVDKKMNGWELNVDMLEAASIEKEEDIKIKIERESNDDIELARENIHLLNGLSGKDIEFDIDYIDGELVINPVQDLTEGLNYLLVMKPNLKNENGFKINQGAVQIIKVQ